MVRSKEVSIRKIIGAAKTQLFIQFIVESALIFVIGSLLAIGLIKLLFPLYNEVSAKSLAFSLQNVQVWKIILLSITASMIVASIYPALLLSSFRPLEALKGKFMPVAGNSAFRKILVVTQFVFSAGLIIATIVISRQLKFLREKDLGYNKEHVFSFGIRQEMYNHYQTVRSELLKMPGVLAVSSSNNNILDVSATTGDTDWDGKERGRSFLIHATSIDENYIPLFKLQLDAGSNFTGVKSDSVHVLLNETAIDDAGIKEPIGKRFQLWGTDATIIGVLKDFNYASLKQKIEPVIFYYQPANWRIFIKTTGRDAKKAIAAAENMWKKYNSEYPFQYSFVDEDYNNLYRTDQRTGILFNVFAFVAITISCLGLFGLAAYTAQVKTKEIGIRKVLGASVAQITQFLAKEFFLLVLISLVIAVPVAWWAMHEWLRDFAYRVSISWWIFIVAAVLAMVIAMIAVSFHAIKAAFANPVHSLKEE